MQCLSTLTVCLIDTGIQASTAIFQVASSCCRFQDKAAFKSLDFNLVLWRQTLQIFEFQYTLYHNLLMAVSYGDSVLHEGDR